MHKTISRATFYSKFKFRKNDKTGIRIKLGKFQAKILLAPHKLKMQDLGRDFVREKIVFERSPWSEIS